MTNIPTIIVHDPSDIPADAVVIDRHGDVGDTNIRGPKGATLQRPLFGFASLQDASIHPSDGPWVVIPGVHEISEEEYALAFADLVSAMED